MLGIALFLRWCAPSGRHWRAGVEHLGLFITWLQHAGPQVSGADAVPGEQVLAGPGRTPVRGGRRVSAGSCSVRGFVAHAVSSGQAPTQLLVLIYPRWPTAVSRREPARGRHDLSTGGERMSR